jgi:hypothetical protein
MKLTAFEAPPPGGAFVTTTGKEPATARSEGARLIVSAPLLRNAARCTTPLNVTEEGAMNPPPLMVTVSGPDDPAIAEDGESPDIAGRGFGPAALSTAIVTAFEVVPPMEIVTGTASPLGAPAGTSAFT